MIELGLSLSGQRLRKRGKWPTLFAGSKGYVRFAVDMDSDWRACSGRVMRFAADGVEAYSPICRDGSCALPDEVSDAGMVVLTAIGENDDVKIVSGSLEVRQR